MARTKVFISYSHKDERWRERLVGHLGVLERAGLIQLCDDHKIRAGEDFMRRIHEDMLQARIAVLLVSADFLTSEFIQVQEVPRLFDQHASDGMTIYPLLVRECAWQEVPWLATLQVRPRDAKAVAARRDKADQVLADVAREVAELARTLPV